MTPPTSLTDLLAPIKKRLADATPGPFIVQRFDNEGGHISYQVEAESYGIDEIVFAWCSELTNFRRAKSNAELIASAPTDLSRLIRAVEILWEANESSMHHCDKCEACDVFHTARNGRSQARAQVLEMMKGQE